MIKLKETPTRKQSVVLSLAAVAIIGLAGGGTYFAMQNYDFSNVSAYTSADNPQDSLTAPDSYVVNIPDANLRTALNAAIASATGTTRGDTAPIAAGEMRQLVGTPGATWDDAGTMINLNARNISNLEGIQYATNLRNLSIENNQIVNVAPLASLPNLEVLRIERNQITDISAFATTPKLKWLRAGYNKVHTPAQVATSTTIVDLHVNNMNLGASKINLAGLEAMPNLTRLNTNTNKLVSGDYEVLKTSASLEVLMTAGNNIFDLQPLVDDGFVNLKHFSTFSSQTHAVTVTDRVIPNPLRNTDGSVVPIVDNASFTNVDASGAPNKNGGHVKIADNLSSGTGTANWNVQFTRAGWPQTRPFSGVLTINYDIDVTAPRFTPDAPAKIVSRKGAAINITDVTAEDNPGGSGLNADGITNNATTIGLDPANPAAGNYTLTYSATDNQNNTSTVNREVEITDADALEAKVAEVTPDLLKGHTAASVAQVQAKKQAAEAIIANNASTQAEIDQALAELVDAISDLEVDRTELADAINDAQSQPDYIRNNPAVAAAMANAEALLLNEDASIDQISAAAQALRQAVQDAIDAEQQKQQAATTAIENATASPSPATFANAQSAVDQIGDPAVKAQKQAELDALVNNYNAIVGNLEDLIAKAQDPATTAGMTADSVKALEEALADVLANFSNTSSQAEVEAMTAALDAALKGLTPVAPAPTPVPTDPQTGAGQNTNTGTGATAPDSGVASQSIPAVIAAALGAISLLIGGIVALVRKRSDR